MKSDFFNELDGLDPMMNRFGEALDFTWRAQVAGADVALASDARVRHLEATSTGMRPTYALPEDESFEEADDAVLRRRARFRTALKVHRGFGFLRALFIQLLSALAELITGAVRGDASQAGAAIASVTWNISHWRSLLRSKRHLESIRKKSNKELAQRYGSTRHRLSDLFYLHWNRWREEVGSRDFSEDFGRVARTLRRTPVFAAIVVGAIWIIGSRALFSGTFPTFGQLQPLDGPLDSLRRFFAIWPTYNFGYADFVSPVHLLLGGVELLFLGAVGTAQRWLVLAAIPLGLWGVRRLLTPLASRSATLIAGVAYAALPVGYDAIGNGRIDVLVAYGVTPFLFTRILRLDGSEPYPGRRGLLHLQWRKRREEALENLGEESATAGALATAEDVEVSIDNVRQTDRVSRINFLIVRRLLPTSLLTAIVASFAPQMLTVTFIVIVVLLVANAIVDRRTKADVLRLVCVGFGALGLAFVLLLPAFFGNASGFSALWHSELTTPQTFWSLLQFNAATEAASAVTAILLVIAFVPLAVGRGWRFRVAAKFWFIALVSLFLAWLGSNRLLGFLQLDPMLLLVPAGISISANVGVAVVVFEQDLGHVGDFGRRSLKMVSLIAVLLAFVPVVDRASLGSWGLSQKSVSQSLSYMNVGSNNGATGSDGSFRTLWLGNPTALPGGAARFGSVDGAVTLNSANATSVAPPANGGVAETSIGQAIDIALDARSVSLGEAIAPYGIRFIVIPLKTGAEPEASSLSVDPKLVDMLNKQLDLQSLNSDSSVAVYENTEWIPVLPSSLNGDGHARWTGDVPTGDLFVGFASSPSWHLTANGRTVTRETGNSWANSFTVPGASTIELTYRAPALYSVIQILNAVLWIVVIYAALRYLPRRKQFA